MKKGYLTTTDKARIYYEDRGAGPSLLFVPGHMCTSRFFEKNAEQLSEMFRVITMDPRGFGNSSKVLHGNNVERNSDDIRELIEYLELSDVILAGWSLGGSLVMMYAHKYRGKNLKAVMLIDSALYPFSDAKWNTYSARDHNMDEWCGKYNKWITAPEEYYENFMRRIDRGMTKTDAVMLRKEIEKTPPWIGFAIHTDWCHTDTEQYLKELCIPLLIISGEDASMGRHYYEQAGMRLEGIEQAETCRAGTYQAAGYQPGIYKEIYEFKAGGHAMFWTEPERFNLIIRQFAAHIGINTGEKRMGHENDIA